MLSWIICSSGGGSSERENACGAVRPNPPVTEGLGEGLPQLVSNQNEKKQKFMIWHLMGTREGREATKGEANGRDYHRQTTLFQLHPQ